MAATEPKNRYALSFTTGGLLATEAAILAPIFLQHRDWAGTRTAAQERNVLHARVASSATRTVRATIDRLQQLSEAEMQIVADGTSIERGHLMWAAACRRYELIGEFAEEQLRDRFLTLSGTVSYEDYDSFYRAKAMWHDELDGVTESTYKKLRQVLFRMLAEAGLATKEGRIEPALLSMKVTECLASRTPSDTRFFPTRGA